ncbi:DUF4364 family protein [Ruminococcus sp.]|uniref:DUF4364 family protein n=1 Tax=Ruminococcus sp. TaxID=41978 RepID=UPI003F080A9D
MAFDTFDEGVTLGGVRSKNEIRILICYLLYCVKENMDKELVVQAITIDELANYFEVSAAFDDLIKNGNIKESEIVDGTQTYELTDNGKMIANQLESILSYTVKEKAYVKAIQLLGEKKKRRENSVDIKKTENGFDVICKISGGDMDLLTFTLYAPTFEQAMVMKKNFFDNPSTVYKVMLALMTKDKENVGEALEELYGVL